MSVEIKQWGVEGKDAAYWDVLGKMPEGTVFDVGRLAGADWMPEIIEPEEGKPNE